MLFLVISTIPHLFSILPLIKYYTKYTKHYINIILLSTTFSILYHAFDESNIIINFFDYFFACIWFLYDLYMGYTYTNKKTLLQILIANILVFLINIMIPYNLSYQLNHSLWHLINASKCFYVSNLISINLATLNN